MLIRRTRRRGTVLVESAVVYVVLIVLVFGILVLGMTVFRYQQVAHAAREGARWASVHGSEYGKLPGKTAATEQDVYDDAIAAQTYGMNTPDLTYSVTWPNGNSPKRYVIVTDAVTGLPTVVPRANTVEVTVTYS